MPGRVWHRHEQLLKKSLSAGFRSIRDHKTASITTAQSWSNTASLGPASASVRAVTAFFNSCSWSCGPRPGHENGRPSVAAALTGSSKLGLFSDQAGP